MNVLVIFMFIFVLQGVWLFIGELAGKDLDAWVIFKFILYFMPRMVPIVVPLTILLSSIMVFGNFAENYEFAAMKSNGISLQRAMKSLTFFIVGLGICIFFFANNVIPWGEYNFFNLRQNIFRSKPSMVIAAGQFNEIGDITMKVQSKSGDRNQFLDNIIIHKKKPNRIGNYTVIVAEKGELISSVDSDLLQLELKNGHYYDEIFERKRQRLDHRPHAKSSFNRYIINVDLNNKDVDFEDKQTEDRYNMLNISRLKYTIDSLQKKENKFYKSVDKNLYNRTGFASLNNKLDVQNDTLFKGDFLTLFKLQSQAQILNSATSQIASSLSIIETSMSNEKQEVINKNKHIIAYHDKFVLGFACIVLFFVGAPLGAIIRKGGLGLPIVIAVVLFLTYYFIGIGAKKSAETGTINPVLGTWISTLIMLPLGIYLTRSATKDKKAFSLDGMVATLFHIFRIKSKTEKNEGMLFKETSEAYQTLNSYDTKKLIDVLKNYRKYGYSLAYKNTALSLLNDQGITLQQLKLIGEYSNYTFDEAERYYDDMEKHSKLVLILYVISLFFLIPSYLPFLNKYPTLTIITPSISILISIFYFFVFLKLFALRMSFYKLLKKHNIGNSVLFFLLGIPFYVLVYFFLRKSTLKELNQIQ